MRQKKSTNKMVCAGPRLRMRNLTGVCPVYNIKIKNKTKTSSRKTLKEPIAGTNLINMLLDNSQNGNNLPPVCLITGDENDPVVVSALSLLQSLVLLLVVWCDDFGVRLLLLLEGVVVW